MARSRKPNPLHCVVPMPTDDPKSMRALRPGPEGLERFIASFTDDTQFRQRVYGNPGAALEEAGVCVPRGVRIGFAADASSALGMVLDRQADVTSRDRELDDSELLDVVGGIGPQASMEEVRDFLRVLRLAGA